MAEVIADDDAAFDAAFDTPFDAAFDVGDSLEIECSITKDREPYGKVDFALFVGDEEVEVKSVLGRSVWQSGCNIAR